MADPEVNSSAASSSNHVFIQDVFDYYGLNDQQIEEYKRAVADGGLRDFKLENLDNPQW